MTVLATARQALLQRSQRCYGSRLLSNDEFVRYLAVYSLDNLLAAPLGQKPASQGFGDVTPGDAVSDGLGPPSVEGLSIEGQEVLDTGRDKRALDGRIRPPLPSNKRLEVGKRPGISA